MKKVRVHITKTTVNAPTYSNVTFEPTLINFFYGKNGTGKSTLARSFKDGNAALTWDGQPFPEERVLVYNEDFIRKNVQSYGNIPGVFTISEVNAQKKKEADEKAIEKKSVDDTIVARGKEAVAKQGELDKLHGDYVEAIWGATKEFRDKFPLALAYLRDKKKFADDHIRQFFCMTHNPYFFREISYNRLPDYECVSFFEIKKDTQNQTSITECQDEDTIAGGGLINRSPVRNTYDTLWHEYATTSDPDTLLIVIRQILEYYFIQMVGYQNGNLRSDLLDKNEREFVRILDDGSEDRSDYVSAAAMIAMLNVGATGFNDGLYYDSSATSVEQLRSVFERIFKVMHQEQHFNMMTRKAR